MHNRKARIKEDLYFDSVPVYSEPYNPNPVEYLKTGSTITVVDSPNSEGPLQLIRYHDLFSKIIYEGYILKTRIEFVED